MGYYLPINDYISQQYRNRIEENVKSPYYIERKYRIVLNPIKDGQDLNRQWLYKHASKLNTEKNKERFSIAKGIVEGKGDRINVQV